MAVTDKGRVSGLADGIFAIVMTLLVIEIRVPHLPEPITNGAVAQALLDLIPLFRSYLLSFLLLATYWIAHHFIISTYARNISRNLTIQTLVLLLFVGFVPFSTHLVDSYPGNQLAVVFYAINIIVIGLTLLWMFSHAKCSSQVETSQDYSQRDLRFVYIRMVLPVIAAIIAIIISYSDPDSSLYFFTAVVIFNLIPGGLNLIDLTLRRLFGKDWHDPSLRNSPTG